MRQENIGRIFCEPNKSQMSHTSLDSRQRGRVVRARDRKFKSAYKFRRVRKECPPPNTVVVSCNQKFSNFALCYSQEIAMDPCKIKDFKTSLVFSEVAENTSAIPVQIPSHR